MYQQMLKSINTFVGSEAEAKAFYKKQSKLMPFTKVFNPLSSRYIIKKSDGSCKAAGLCAVEAEAALLFYVNRDIQQRINQAA